MTVPVCHYQSDRFPLGITWACASGETVARSASVVFSFAIIPLIHRDHRTTMASEISAFERFQSQRLIQRPSLVLGANKATLAED